MSDAEARSYLTSLPGVGPKTAAVVLSFALGRDAIPVDTHVHRVSKRLGLVPPNSTAEKADRLLHDLVPDGLRTPLHVALIRLGREICKAPTRAAASARSRTSARRRLATSEERSALERVRGIEPPSQAWEAYVLPLNHTRVAPPDAPAGPKCSERLAPRATCYVASPMAELDPDFWPHTLSRVIAHQALTADEAAEAMRVIMSGEASPGQIGGFLMALRTKGETVDELEGLARTALGFANPVRASSPVVDTCGTGGDRSGTFNISTVAAIVVAGAGVPVAKHGNRAASSHCGSADLLEALGVKIDLGPEGVERCLADAGIGFMFAPVFHPAAAHAGPVRRELRVPTVFNFLGPLTNPARPFAQVVGVSDERMLPLVAEVLAGAARARRSSAARTAWTSSPPPGSPRSSTSGTGTSWKAIWIPRRSVCRRRPWRTCVVAMPRRPP